VGWCVMIGSDCGGLRQVCYLGPKKLIAYDVMETKKNYYSARVVLGGYGCGWVEACEGCDSVLVDLIARQTNFNITHML
jgi:hypothetical protein